MGAVNDQVQGSWARAPAEKTRVGRAERPGLALNVGLGTARRFITEEFREFTTEALYVRTRGI